MGGKPSKAACKIRGIRIIGVEPSSHSVQIIMKFTIVVSLAQAAVKDKDKMILLEDEIKDALQEQPAKTPLSQDLIDRIKGKAKQINDEDSQNENQK